MLGFDDAQTGALQGAIAEAMGVPAAAGDADADAAGDAVDGGGDGFVNEDDGAVDVTEPCAASLRNHAKALLRSQLAESQQTLLSYGTL